MDTLLPGFMSDISAWHLSLYIYCMSLLSGYPKKILGLVSGELSRLCTSEILVYQLPLDYGVSHT